MKIRNSECAGITVAVADAICANKDYLSEVDGLIGDGDHGINMNKGFSMFREKSLETEMDFTTSLATLGRILLGDIGGSMGPLYGTFFIEMSKQSKNAEEIDANVFAEMLIAALEGVQKIGEAQVGDKTLIDTLFPACDAFVKSVENGDNFITALQKMKTAAEQGRDKTKDMIAKVGRASRLGERSRGVLDAGATSCCIILCAMSDKIIQLTSGG